MLLDQLQLRDREILRTLARLRYVTTRELLATFFGTASVGRRRLARLADYDLITPHRKGVPESLPFSAWRLTTTGLEVVLESFPDEPLPDGLAERLADGSLYNLDHRAALNRLYLKLVTRGVTLPEQADLPTMKTVMTTIRERGSTFWWQPDGDVVLKFKRLGEDLQIVPDGTLCSRDRPSRVFLELDRSTRGLTRIEENLQRYATLFGAAYAPLFPDGRTPYLLYIVRSEGRKAGIDALAHRHLSTVRRAVLLESDAIAWLERELITPEGSPAGANVVPATQDSSSRPGDPGPEPLRAAAKRVYLWARTYAKELRTEGRDLPQEGQAVLQDLYRELRHAGGARDAR